MLATWPVDRKESIVLFLYFPRYGQLFPRTLPWRRTRDRAPQLRRGGLGYGLHHRAFNALITESRWLIPILRNRLERIGKTLHLTKLDVTSAF